MNGGVPSGITVLGEWRRGVNWHVIYIKDGLCRIFEVFNDMEIKNSNIYFVWLNGCVGEVNTYLKNGVHPERLSVNFFYVNESEKHYWKIKVAKIPETKATLVLHGNQDVLIKQESGLWKTHSLEEGIEYLQEKLKELKDG